MHVEPGTERDAARIAELARFGGATVDAAIELTRVWARLWVAREAAGGAALGFLLAWDAADEVHLVDVVTHPDARRRGVARALIQTLIAHASGRGARLILLEVRRSNHGALMLYRGAGFRAVGLRSGYYADNGEDAVEMQLELDPQSGLVLPGEDEVDLVEQSAT
ncbi:MAG TPA: GNAT family N-acetyltransferase [Polyangiaceae bacterium]|jgi:ribosomal-protein-alanine N-acetyltransferase|nr:GNAT family N-acetyltransferase [Polyangiaceae bacterium]